MDLKGGRYVSQECMGAEKRYRYIVTVAPGHNVSAEDLDELMADMFRELKTRSVTITRYDPIEHEMLHVNMSTQTHTK